MIAIGIGASNSAHPDDFDAALELACREAGGCEEVATLATATFARHVQAAAERAALSFRPVMLIGLRERSADCVTRSKRSLALFGVNSIAEAAALVSAGAGSRLIMPRRVIGNITVAAAQSPGRGG
ncbi:cobalamin biosynthesis protein [Hyphomicrobium sp.]|uniref:cobalamin biosynthesis protein n=1 Tax=Hyphomicrobium sp. TaxID=82 RepID=UPI002D769CD6|nr:cobalamin biosynthesis protein [Hyphomicrobium sp.]HET6389037.1 cobalamin biosynthesis protein [Hyphomicrobium sp.]